MFQRDEEDKQNRLLVIQCDSGHLNGDLIACARYRIYDERVNALNKNKIQNRDGVTHVLFIINLPHQVSSSTFVGFQGNPWISSHIDDLRPTSSDTIEPLHAIATSISELFIGEYIHDIAPLLDTSLEQIPRQPSQPDKEENLLDEEGATQEMPMHDAGEDADIEDEGDEIVDDAGAHQIQPELQAVQDAGVEPNIGATQMQPELQAVHDAGREPDIEATQMQPELQAGNSSSPTEELPEIPGQPSVPFEPTAVDPLQQQTVQEQEEESSTNLATAQTDKKTEPDATTSQEIPVHFGSLGDDGHQASLSHESVALPSMDDSVTPSQAALSTEPEVPMTASVNPEGTSKLEVHQNSAKGQTPGGQCRRLYGCIQAAASRLEDSTKDRSTQRVTRLTKLIQRYPDHLSK